ncbi:MAG: LON peptidase substrate-binding domain-containing protein [Methanobacteriota archaeon]
MRLPLFPLNAVLFPGTSLPLHIFEPRYREMVGRCLEHGETFGIALLVDGDEGAQPGTPHRIGTEAAIIASRRYPDGRYDIVVEGRRRFETVQLDRTRKLLRADVEFWKEVPGHGADEIAQVVAALVEGAVEAIEVKGQAVVDETWRDLDASSLSYRVASVLPTTDEVKQELLEIPDAAARLRREAKLLMSIRRIDAETGAA